MSLLASHESQDPRQTCEWKTAKIPALFGPNGANPGQRCGISLGSAGNPAVTHRERNTIRERSAVKGPRTRSATLEDWQRLKA